MSNFFHNLSSSNKFRRKLIVFFLMTTLITGITSVYTYYNAKMFMRKTDAMFKDSIKFNDLHNNVNMVEMHLENFLSTKHSESLREYIKYSNQLRRKAEDILSEVSGTENGLILRDIGNMILTYLGETDAAVSAKRGRDVNDYTARYIEASKIADYINMYINKLEVAQLRENTATYLAVSGRLNMIQLLNIGLIIGTVIFNLVLILWFTYKITKPIVSLSRAADKISRGNFDVEELSVDTDDEVSLMASAFNRMASSIKTYIDEIKEKAKLEGRLKEQEMQNLFMKNLLREAELHALQSQINPHFIFNTLNAGAQIAMLEGADKTCVFLENTANLFRYNLRKLDKPVTLREEIENINTYIYILKTRFTDRIEFEQQVDESVVDIQMPRMILQPLVGNAFIHGISDMENGGRIVLRVVRNQNEAEVEIEDNGKGMDEEKVKAIFAESTEQYDVTKEHEYTGHTNGIGLNNIISRLRLYFQKDDVVKIFSSPGKGTRIVITMPINNVERSGGHVQTACSG